MIMGRTVARSLFIVLCQLSASETEDFEQIITEEMVFKGDLISCVEIQPSVGEGDMRYGEIPQTRQILNEGDCKG